MDTLDDGTPHASILPFGLFASCLWWCVVRLRVVDLRCHYHTTTRTTATTRKGQSDTGRGDYLFTLYLMIY